MTTVRGDELLSEGLWPKLVELRKKGDIVRAAIAYYSFDHLKLRKGDWLVVNASTEAVSCGATSGPLLLRLVKAGVKLYNQESLHAKVISVGEYAVVGSANSSRNSMEHLTEAAILSKSLRTRSLVASFIDSAALESKKVTLFEANRLASIKVTRKRLEHKSKPLSLTLGSGRSWWLATKPMSKRLLKLEKDDTERGELEAQKSLGGAEVELDFIRYSTKNKTASQLKTGDFVFQAYSKPWGATTRTEVFCQASIVYVQREKGWIRFWLRSLLDDWHSAGGTTTVKVLSNVSRKPPTIASNRELSGKEADELVAFFQEVAKAEKKRR